MTRETTIRNRPALPLQLIAGVALVVFAALVIFGWLTREPRLLQLATGTVAIVINTALCFALAGAALIVAARSEATPILAWLAAALAVLPALVLADSVFVLPYSLDWTDIHAWLDDGSPMPGRMAPTTCVGFLIAAALLAALRYPHSRGSDAARVAILLLLTLALTGVAGFWLRTPLVYAGVGVTMALPTALAMTVLSVGLWKAHVRSRSNASERAITRASAVAVGLSVLGAGLLGLVLLMGQTEAAIEGWLRQKANLRTALLDEAIHDALAANLDLAQDPEELDRLIAPTNGYMPVPKGQRGVRGVAVIDADGRTQVRRGRMDLEPEFAVVLRDGGRARQPDESAAQLVWSDGLVLRSRVSVRGRTVVIDRAVPRLAGQFTDATAFGRTGEVRLCAARASTQMDCLPNWRIPRVSLREPRSPDGQPTPMSLALLGRTDVVEARDYRGVDVLAAHAPIAAGTLGLVVKQDSAEIFQPIRKRVLIGVPLLLLLAIIGVFYIRRQVRPMAAALAESEQTSRRARDELATVMASISDGLVLSDETGTLLFANQAAERVFGYGPGTLVGRSLRDLMPPRYHDAHDAGMRRYLLDGTRRVIGRGSIELSGLRQGGTEFPLELTVDTVATDGTHTFVGVVRDVTARHQAQQALHLEKERLRVTLHSIGDAVLTTDVAGLVTYINPVAEGLMGVASVDAVGREISSILTLVEEGTGASALNPVLVVLESGETTGMQVGTTLVRPDGRRVSIEDSAAPILNATGEIEGVVLVFHDVTAARELAVRISHDATHDPLTDLANRRGFEAALHAALDDPTSGDKGHVLLYIDLDQFKIVNDTCGHAAGDALLQEVSSVLRSGLRDTDLLARLGGDEFAVLLRQCPLEAGERVAEKLRLGVDRIRFVSDERVFHIGASIGLVAFDAGDAMSQVMSAADSACYIAKEKGRNRVHVHDDLDRDVIERKGELNWASQLTRALDENRFELHAQQIVPTVAEETDRHFEILLRLRGDAGEMISPMAFIPAAERYGLMANVDRWVIRQAFAQLAACAPGVIGTRLSINLSARSLSEDDFVAFVESQFREHRIPHAQICFEITETAAIANLGQAERFITWFKQHGCRFSLDDFGSGMSSFGYLRRLRVDYIKIDGAFVRNLLNDAVDEAMVTAIHGVSTVMGLQLVAEWVEDQPTLAKLASMGVQFAQGYGIHRPEPLAKLLLVDAAPSA